MPTISEQRQRVAEAVCSRRQELGLSIRELAGRANVDPKTLRDLLSGKRWPHQATRDRLCRALGWSNGHLTRVAVDGDMMLLREFPDEALRQELARRDEERRKADKPQ